MPIRVGAMPQGKHFLEMLGIDQVRVDLVGIRAILCMQAANPRPDFLPTVQVDRPHKYRILDAVKSLGLKVIMQFRAALAVGDVVINDAYHSDF